MKLQNDLLLRAARGEKTERTPVWLMRQAGRILPEYRAVRESVSGFIELAQTPELAAEVTIQPVDILGVDAAIIFSDILVIPEAMGLPYEMVEKRGPWFPATVRSEADLKKLRVADGDNDLKYVIDAIHITKKNLNGRVPLIGFAGAPWTIFAYMVEGSGSKTFSKSREMLYREPVFSHKLLQLITDSTINYLKAQIRAGADLVQIFDSWAGILGPKQYQEFSMTDKTWSRGCYAALMQPHAWTDFQDAYRSPLPPLYFAGTEAAVKWHGYIEGAVLAGESAATDVLTSLAHD